MAPPCPSRGRKAPTWAPPLQLQAREGGGGHSPGTVRQRPFRPSSPHPVLPGALGKLEPTRAGRGGHSGLLSPDTEGLEPAPSEDGGHLHARQQGQAAWAPDRLTARRPLPVPEAPGRQQSRFGEPGQARPRTKLGCCSASKGPLTARLEGATPAPAAAQCPLHRLQTDPGPGRDRR